MQPILEAKGIVKKFGSFYALDNVDFEIYPGKVNVLIGENGAGKSTILKILSGVYLKDAGDVFYEGKKVDIKSPQDAEKLGISTVYQELSLVSGLSIAENIFLGSALKTNKAGYISWKKMQKDARDILVSTIGLDIDTRQPVKSLGIAQQQMIEIARAIHRNGRILILDEPTAVLTNDEVKKLFEVMRKLRSEGIAIVYISHRLEEIFEIGDRVTVLRDGKLVQSSEVSEINTDALITAMVGRSINDLYPKCNFADVEKKEILRVQNLKRGQIVNDVSFALSTGEVLGFAGLVGAGRTEIARAIFGADKLDSGSIFIKGVEKKIPNTAVAVREGLALLPESRKEQGLVVKHSIKNNISLVNLKMVLSKIGSISKKKEMQFVEDYVGKLRISVRDITDPVTSLSGGNQQKVVIAKWMFSDAAVMIFDEPTRGIDVGAKTEVYNLINSLVKLGKGIIIISSELPELTGICDRILTVRNGRITGEFNENDGYDQDILLKAMLME